MDRWDNQSCGGGAYVGGICGSGRESESWRKGVECMRTALLFYYVVDS